MSSEVANSVDEALAHVSSKMLDAYSGATTMQRLTFVRLRSCQLAAAMEPFPWRTLFDQVAEAFLRVQIPPNTSREPGGPGGPLTDRAGRPRDGFRKM